MTRSPVTRPAVALLALLALLVAALGQQVASVRCTMSGALHWVACCQVAASADEGPALDTPACCEHQEHPEWPAAAPVAGEPAGEAASLAPTPAVAVPAWDLPSARSQRAALGLAPRGPPARAGPLPPRSLARRLATLSVLRS